MRMAKPGEPMAAEQIEGKMPIAARHGRLIRWGRFALGSGASALPPFLTCMGILLAWEALARLANIPQIILPPPSEVAAEILRSFPLLAKHALATGTETVVAYLLSAALGIVIASALTLFRPLKEAFYPYLVALQTVPKIALAPLFIVWLSIGFESRLAIGVFVSVFSIIVSLMSGLRATPPDILRLARSVRAGTLQTFFHVRFPYALAYLFSGLKIASTTVVIGVVVGEFISSEVGLGHLIMFAASRLETQLVMAAIAVLCLIGIAMYGTVSLLERLVQRWYPL